MRRIRRLAPLALLLLVASLPACGGGGGGDDAEGIVGRLTGDPDDEVTHDLEVLVDRALDRDDSDAPIED